MTIAVVLQTYTHMYMYYGFLRCMGILPHKGYNPYALVQLTCTMQLGCIFIRVYETSRVHVVCTSCFSFEVWLHHSTSTCKM